MNTPGENPEAPELQEDALRTKFFDLLKASPLITISIPVSTEEFPNAVIDFQREYEGRHGQISCIMIFIAFDSTTRNRCFEIMLRPTGNISRIELRRCGSREYTGTSLTDAQRAFVRTLPLSKILQLLEKHLTDEEARAVTLPMP